MTRILFPHTAGSKAVSQKWCRLEAAVQVVVIRHAQVGYVRCSRPHGHTYICVLMTPQRQHERARCNQTGEEEQNMRRSRVGQG